VAWFRKYYRHKKCHLAWTDEWSAACNDKCPRCGAEIEPYDSDDLSVLVDQAPDEDGWVVRVSARNAEITPDYTDYRFNRKEEAQAFAENLEC